ncbi:hypothetical protein C442_06056 [Haloarcula amylolytica JCM 13557]|uniref:Uncharacterized protein n=1 Tax=Haloarcula amylolytica JCM 13557 TaxID=1227452 RepID=M0KSS0_9EURY|nr:hypothetical protein C442_06056 [Haloarcula amylolytica JCM 13557]
MDAFWRNVPPFVYDRSVVKVHLSVCLESVGPDLSQRLGEVFSLLNHRLKITFVINTQLATNYT